MRADQQNGFQPISRGERTQDSEDCGTTFSCRVGVIPLMMKMVQPPPSIPQKEVRISQDNIETEEFYWSDSPVEMFL